MEQLELELDEGAGLPIDKMVSTYIKIRDHRKKLKDEFEAADAAIETQLKTIESTLLSKCKADGADSIRTQYGTVIRSIKSRYWTNDWETMYAFIADHELYSLLEKRLHQSNMKQFLEENPELKPAGLNVDNEYTITVRRK
jgi:hypothetical protein